MRKQRIGVLLSILTIISLIICLSVPAAALTNDEITAKLDTIKENSWPDGSTYTGTFGGASLPGQCYGFGRLLANEVFGSYPWNCSVYSDGYTDGNGWKLVTGSSLDTVLIEPGDIIEVRPTDGKSDHTAIVWKTAGAVISVAECWGSSGTVNWGNFNGSNAYSTLIGIMSAYGGSGNTYVWKHPGGNSELVTPDEPVEYTFADLFPDANFRAYVTGTVLAKSTDAKGDSDIPTQEQMNIIGNCIEINVNSSRIFSLKGISLFSELKKLNCNTNNLTKLDVSHNTELTYLSCDINSLTELDVSQNTALTLLSCRANQLTELDVSHNKALTNLDCSQNQLTELDISQNTALTWVGCYSNQLTKLDVSQNTALIHLYCYVNKLTELDVSQNTALIFFNCTSNKLTELDVSKNTALSSLECNSNQLAELDVSKNTALSTLECNSNQLTKLDLSHNTGLYCLYCNSNQLTELDISHNTSLYYLSCSSNQLTELDLSKNTNLSNQWTSLSYQLLLRSDVFVAIKNSGYELRLLQLAPGIDLSRVSMNDGGTLDTSTGIVTYTEKPETVSYLYQTNSPNRNKMIVNWTPVFAESSVLPGDLDGDGALSSADVVMLAKFLVGAVTLTDDQIAAADLNGDGAVTAADTVLLAKKLLAGN